MEKKVITVGKDGTIKFVYDEKLTEGLESNKGEKQIKRLSNVEPNENGKWGVHFADKEKPEEVEFNRRSDAIAYEINKAQQMLAEGKL